MLLSEALKDAKIRQWLLDMAKATIKRDVDQQRLAPLLVELANMPQEPQQ